MAYEDRVDPSEPWRYRCVSCGSVMVRFFRGKKVRADWPGKMQSRKHNYWGPHFYCANCGDYSDTVRDAKNCSELFATSLV